DVLAASRMEGSRAGECREGIDGLTSPWASGSWARFHFVPRNMRANDNLHASGPAVSNAVSRGVASRPLATSSLRILVVDDGADGAEGMSLLLETLGHEVVTAGDGAAALATLEEWRPDVALVDIRLPGMDGYELASRIRVLDPDRTIRLVALTGFV